MENLVNRKIKRASNLIGFGGLFGSLIFYLYYFFMGGQFYEYLSAFLIPVFLFLGYIIAFLVGKEKLKDLFLFKKPKGNFLKYILIGLGSVVIALLLTSSIILLRDFSDINLFFGVFNFPFLDIILGIVFVCFLPVFLEEIICRGMIFGLLKPYGSKFAIICSAIMFVFIHGNTRQWGVIFLLGLFLGFLLLKTQSLWPGILFRFLINSILFLFNYNYFLQNVITVKLVFGITIIIVSLIIFYLCKKSNKNFFETDNELELAESKGISLTEKLSSFIITPGMILFLGFCLFGSIML